MDDLTGHLTTSEKRKLLEELFLFPLLQHKLRLLEKTTFKAIAV
jgi:hypothetical protein